MLFSLLSRERQQVMKEGMESQETAFGGAPLAKLVFVRTGSFLRNIMVSESL